MKDLVFSISLRNHTFYIRTTPRSILCSYDTEGKYTTSLIFASNTYASIEYKNVRFSGTVTKRNNWYVKLDRQTIIEKRYNGYYYISNESAQQTEKNVINSDIATECSDNILWLYNQLIDFLHEHYLCIEDKDTFKDQLCEYLYDHHSDIEIDDLDTIIEYENWDDVEADKDPTTEEISLKNFLIEDCRDFFIRFRQAEIDNKNKIAIITLENIINETPELSQFPHELLQKVFCSFCDKNNADLIKPDIWYYKEDILMTIGDEILKSCQYLQFINTVEEKIDKILSSMDVEDIDKEELYSYFKLHYYKECLPSDEEFESNVREFVNEQVRFTQLYRKYVTLFGTDHIKIEWDDEKLRLFQKYDEAGQIDNPQNLAEYEAYKYVIPFFRKHFFRKNSNRYKPIIEQLPAFTSYGSTVLDILFKHQVITCNEDIVVYNNDGSIELACKEIMAIPAN